MAQVKPFDSFVYFNIAGNSFPVGFTGWECTMSSYGAAGTASVTFSKKDLDEKGLQILELSQLSDIGVEIFAPSRNQTYKGGLGLTADESNVRLPIGGQFFGDIKALKTRVPPTYEKNFQIPAVFGGIMDSENISFRGDEVKIDCRDYSSLLQDKMIADARLVNMSVGEAITLFCKDVGISTAVTPNYIQGADVTVGHYLQIDHVQLATLTTRWDLMQRLAKNLGYICMVLPTKEIYFAPPDALKKVPREFTWGKDIEDLEMRYSPRRNRSFKVVVKSYHPKSAKIGLGQFSQIGTGRVSRDLPTYEFFVEGKTTEQCQKLARGWAEEISRREISLNVKVAGDAGILPWQGGVIIRNAHSILEDRILNIPSVSHSYQVPQSGEGEGYSTNFTAQNLPPSESFVGESVTVG